MKSRYLMTLTAVTCAAVLAAAVGLGAQGRQGGPPPEPPKPGQLAPDYFKNIKVLKNVPADQLRTQMEYFTAALGVNCNFCHVQGQFDSDENPRKDRARKMMAMVDRFNDNPSNDVTVTCATCHHGHVPPERTPSLAVPMTQEEAAAAAAARAARGGGPGGPGRGPAGPGAPGAAGRGPGGPGGAGGQRGGPPQAPPKPTETADAVLAKYVQALGGQAALASVKSRVLEGAQTTRDLQTTPIKVQEKVSGEYRIDVASQPNPAVRVSTKSGAWATGFGPNARDLEGIQAAQVARPTDFGLGLNAKTLYSSFEVRRYENVDGKRTVVIDAKRSPIVTESLYFDTDSGLLLRRVIQTKTAYGNLLEQVDYSDYKEAAGIKIPFTVRHATWNQVTTEKFVDAKVNAQIDDAVFEKK